MVTQVEIARRVGLDVSSVNKILNEVPGPVFAKETKKLVFQVAKKMGYPLKRETKYSLRTDKAELKKALEDVYAQYWGMGGRVLKPETITTIAKHFQPVGSPKQVATG